MDAPHVHRLFVRSAVVGHRLAPFAIVAAIGGLTVWLVSLHKTPGLAAPALVALTSS